MEVAVTVTAATPCTAQEVVREHLNELFDAAALLEAAEGRMGDEMQTTLRLVQMAREKLNAAADALASLD